MTFVKEMQGREGTAPEQCPALQEMGTGKKGKSEKIIGT